MSIFSENDNLLFPSFGAGGIKFLFDALLQAKHYRTSGIDDFDVVLSGELVGQGRFSVCTEQYFGILQLCKLIVVDGIQSQMLQPFTFTPVVYDISQAVERFTLCQFFFSFPDSSSHSKAKA